MQYRVYSNKSGTDQSISPKEMTHTSKNCCIHEQLFFDTLALSTKLLIMTL